MIFACYSCRNKPINLEKERPFPIINDSTLFLDSNKHVEWYDDDGNDRQPIYIGKYADTINLSPVHEWEKSFSLSIIGSSIISKDKRTHRKGIIPKRYRRNRDEFKPFHRRDSAFFRIKVDTNQSVYNKGRSAYPILFENVGTDTVCVGYRTRVPFTLKSKDTNSNWKKVHDGYNMGCGNGIRYFFLPPGEIVITSFSINKEAKRSEFMIKFGKSYSKRFFANY